MATTLEQTTPRGQSAEEERLLALRKRDTRRKWFWRLTGYVVVLGLWELVSGWILNENLLPGPIRIIETFPEILASGRFFSSFGATLTRIGVGFGLAFAFGVLLGIFTQNKWIDGFFKDGVTISLVSPGLIWALVGLVIWGFEPQGWIFAIFMTTVALVTVNISEGIRALPKDLIDMSKAFGVTTWRRQREIVIPFLAPFIFTALRFGFSIGWKVTVLTEVFSSNKGIGFEMRVASQLFRMDEFFTWVLSFFVFALFLEKVVLQRYENKFFRWREEVTT
ncbi:MAG TPA: ABC transporter permease subunit [Acidimicrobiia bacterium]|nr:ABC transporter permease subunit [Acidimicrobiia bacterium]